MKFFKYDFTRSCLMSVLVAGLTMPMVSYAQDNSTQQTQSANQNEQADSRSNQNQQTGAANANRNQQTGAANNNQNQQTGAANNNQNQQAGAASNNRNQQAGATNNSQNQQANSQNQNNQQVDLSNYYNGSFVSLRGTVQSVSPNMFTLSYNNGADQVTVEMDDGDRDADAYVLMAGDMVRVTGLIDRDLFESRKIEAGSVYVDKLNTYFMSSAIDEEDYPLFATVVAIEPASGSGSNSSSSSASGSSSNSASSSASSNRSSAASSSSAADNMPVVQLQGKVSSVSNNSLKIAVGEGDNEITVSTANLSNNPLDNQGGRKIETGDIVQVSGKIDKAFFENQQLQANNIAKIHDRQNINQ